MKTINKEKKFNPSLKAKMIERDELTHSSNFNSSHMKQGSGLVSRQIACDVYRLVLKEKIFISEALHFILSSLPAFHNQPYDEAAITAIVSASFRFRNSLMETVRKYLAKNSIKNDRLEALLITGAAQLLFLEKPAHAVVDDSVKIAKKHPKTSHSSGLINAVLRKIALEKNNVSFSNDPLVDLPLWLKEKWLQFYGKENTVKIATALRNPPYLDLTLKDMSTENQKVWAEKLDAFLLPTGSLRLKQKKAIPSLPGFKEGEWWVQDISASLPVKILKPNSEMDVIELCAAPGGKTLQLLSYTSQVTALDKSSERVQRLKSNLRRMKLEGNIFIDDILNPCKESVPGNWYKENFYDAVLLDAPCSATGTLRRHPEAAWIKSQDLVDQLVLIQKKMLKKASKLLKGGGRLIYCTCSLQHEEGEDQMTSFLAEHPDFEYDEKAFDHFKWVDLSFENNGLRILPFFLPTPDIDYPTLYGMDGFFICFLRKKVFI